MPCWEGRVSGLLSSGWCPSSPTYPGKSRASGRKRCSYVATCSFECENHCFFLSTFHWLCYYSCPFFFPPLSHSTLHLPPSSIRSPTPHLSSWPWVVHISFLAPPFPILLLNSPCLFCAYQLSFLFPVPFPPFSPLHLPSDNPPCDLHYCDSVSVLVLCLVCFWFFRFSCW